jgi:hypothetical protein
MWSALKSGGNSTPVTGAAVSAQNLKVRYKTSQLLNLLKQKKLKVILLTVRYKTSYPLNILWL